jgi:hypothetical protein
MGTTADHAAGACPKAVKVGMRTLLAISYLRT